MTPDALKQKPYKGMIYSKTLDRDVEFWIDHDDVDPDLKRSEMADEWLVVNEIKEYYKNLGDN